MALHRLQEFTTCRNALGKRRSGRIPGLIQPVHRNQARTRNSFRADYQDRYDATGVSLNVLPVWSFAAVVASRELNRSAMLLARRRASSLELAEARISRSAGKLDSTPKRPGWQVTFGLRTRAPHHPKGGESTPYSGTRHRIAMARSPPRWSLASQVEGSGGLFHRRYCGLFRPASLDWRLLLPVPASLGWPGKPSSRYITGALVIAIMGPFIRCPVFNGLQFANLLEILHFRRAGARHYGKR